MGLDLAVVGTVFAIIFVGELPDKTMFASLVMASRGNPLAVWAGAAAAFGLHVAIASTVGVAIFHLLPHRGVNAFVAFLFLAGAVYALVEAGAEDEEALVEKEAASHRRVVTTAFVVIFVAEWGDLTQILTANLAARYHQGFSVAVGAVLGLWSVAGLAVAAGQGLLRRLSVRALRRATAAVLLVLAGVTAWSAVRG